MPQKQRAINASSIALNKFKSLLKGKYFTHRLEARRVQGGFADEIPHLLQRIGDAEVPNSVSQEPL
jgi:hypothetical protein